MTCVCAVALVCVVRMLLIYVLCLPTCVRNRTLAHLLRVTLSALAGIELANHIRGSLIWDLRQKKKTPQKQRESESADRRQEQYIVVLFSLYPTRTN